jgi:MtaA/CmuA family methyltransferase
MNAFLPQVSRDEVLASLHGRRPARKPCFSGLISLTAPGLQAVDLQISHVHSDPARLAQAAASTWQVSGFGSAVLPCDLCVEAEALGLEVDFRDGAAQPELPLPASRLAESAAAFNAPFPEDITRRGRVPVVLRALELLRDEVGRALVIGACVPGPMTLAQQVIANDQLLPEIAEAPQAVANALDRLTPVLIEVARHYRAAGADFITVHEMGGSPGFIGPRSFERLVLPRLQRLMAALPPPRVLSVCGNTNRAMPLLAAAGADALSVDHLNDLARSRATLGPEVLLFGNLDPVGVLARGDEDTVRAAVAQAAQAGADAIWPGCDLWPPVPLANLRAMVDEAARH